MRHPVDTPAWHTIDKKWPSFASDSRNLRLGLSTDGFNPFGDLSSAYSCWPVTLVVYNLSPLELMSKENMMLTLLIPGPRQPGNDIDVYLEPLIDDLKDLWEKGVEIYDAFAKSTFNLKVILMWTISDFPAFSNLSGHVTKGKKACPTCSDDTCSRRLNCSTKTVYLGHRRWLSPTHPFRKKKSWFDGSEEHRWKPKILSRTEILYAVKNIKNDWGKKVKGKLHIKPKIGKRKQKTKKDENVAWKKKSIFFELPFWEVLLVCHNLDVMHIEKNVCESIIGTLLNIKGKSKDGLKSRRDLEEMGIRGDLHPQDSKGKHFVPPAPHTLKKEEKQLFCKRLQQLKLPDGYSSNIGTHISLDECKVVGLKSHDYHVLMQQLLPVALRGILPKAVRNAIFRLCAYFNEVCEMVIDRNSMERQENEIAETLCMLERFFPPSFFDIMIHLTIHIAREARICGPVQFRWMYPFERMMKVYKGYVRNRARPEGYIAEGYLADECVKFCSEHIKQASKIGERHSRNEDFEGETTIDGRPILKGILKVMSNDMLQIAHRYVLFNNAEVEPYTGKHLEELKQMDKRLIRNASALQKKHMETFCLWFANEISAAGNDVSDTLMCLANGPRREVISHSGYIVNGQRFHTKDVERSTQDSGVSLEAKTICQSSARDTNQVLGKVSYYGVLKDILLLDYHTFKVPIFDCEWANIRNGIKVEDGFVLVNLHEGQSQFQSDPFILALQAKQVFYSREDETSNWYVILKAPPRGFNDLESFEENSYVSSMPLDVSRLDSNDDDDGNEEYVRLDCEGMTV
ncbi:uncharacterized protein LOC132316707 [Cornus florida]|uniref:uncharacterized protein LOC132316707 n=1 Tax=Cornus florida TaxID=4283 RepID=UPI00289F9CA9|nr:uncharacterized protein LOC132316707 [Cornus florida]